MLLKFLKLDKEFAEQCVHLTNEKGKASSRRKFRPARFQMKKENQVLLKKNCWLKKRLTKERSDYLSVGRVFLYRP